MSPKYLRTHCGDEVSLQLHALPASASRVLRLHSLFYHLFKIEVEIEVPFHSS